MAVIIHKYQIITCYNYAESDSIYSLVRFLFFKRVAIKQNNLVSFLQIIIRMGFGSIGERAGETTSLYFHRRMKCL